MSSKIKTTISILAKILIFLGIAFIAMIFVVANIGGQNPQLREGAETFLSNVTGARAVIGDMQYLGFIPSIRVEMTDVTFQTDGDPTDIPMTIDEVKFSLPVMHYLLNKKTAEVIFLSGLNSRSGFLTPKKLEISEVSILDNDAVEPSLKVIGKYGAEDYSASVKLIAQAFKEARPVYKLPTVTPVSFQTDGFDFYADLSGIKEGSQLENIRMFEGEGAELSGQAVMNFETGIHFDGDMKIGKSNFKTDISLNTNEDELSKNIEGLFQSEQFYVEDMVALEALFEKVVAFFVHNAQGQRNFALKTDVKFDVDALYCGQDNLGPVNALVQYEGAVAEKSSIWDYITMADLGLTGDSPCATYFNNNKRSKDQE